MITGGEAKEPAVSKRVLTKRRVIHARLIRRRERTAGRHLARRKIGAEVIRNVTEKRWIVRLEIRKKLKEESAASAIGAIVQGVQAGVAIENRLGTKGVAVPRVGED